MTFAALVELARKLAGLIERLVEFIGERLRRRRLDEIQRAHDDAENAKTRQEKIDAAKRLEDSLNLRPADRDRGPNESR